jgi:hypothetical protein
MIPLFPFAAGLLAGAVAVRLTRGEKVQKQLSKAQNCLREAGVSGLSTIEQSAARLREKMVQTRPDDADSAGSNDPTDSEPKAAKKPPRKLSSRPKAASSGGGA